MLSVMAVIFGFLVAMVIMALAGYNPFASIGSLFVGMFGSPKRIFNIFIKSTPIIFTGIGVAFAIKTGLFNIGAEGQFIMAEIAAVLIGITVHLPAFLEIPLIVLAAAVAGGLYGGLVGWLKAKFGINEVITSIMLNWIALYFSNWICGLSAFAGARLQHAEDRCGRLYNHSQYLEAHGRNGDSYERRAAGEGISQDGREHRLPGGNCRGTPYFLAAVQDQKRL